MELLQHIFPGWECWFSCFLQEQSAQQMANPRSLASSFLQEVLRQIREAQEMAIPCPARSCQGFFGWGWWLVEISGYLTLFICGKGKV